MRDQPRAAVDAGPRAADPAAAPYAVAAGPLAGRVWVGSAALRYSVVRDLATGPDAVVTFIFRRADSPAVDPAAFPAVRGYSDLDGASSAAGVAVAGVLSQRRGARPADPGGDLIGPICAHPRSIGAAGAATGAARRGRRSTTRPTP